MIEMDLMRFLRKYCLLLVLLQAGAQVRGHIALTSPYCPTPVTFYCRCEASQEATRVQVQMCSYPTIDDGACHPCPSHMQEVASCNACGSNACPLCSAQYFGGNRYSSEQQMFFTFSQKNGELLYQPVQEAMKIYEGGKADVPLMEYYPFDEERFRYIDDGKNPLIVLSPQDNDLEQNHPKGRERQKRHVSSQETALAGNLLEDDVNPESDQNKFIEDKPIYDTHEEDPQPFVSVAPMINIDDTDDTTSGKLDDLKNGVGGDNDTIVGQLAEQEGTSKTGEQARKDRKNHDENPRKRPDKSKQSSNPEKMLILESEVDGPTEESKRDTAQDNTSEVKTPDSSTGVRWDDFDPALIINDMKPDFILGESKSRCFTFRDAISKDVTYSFACKVSAEDKLESKAEESLPGNVASNDDEAVQENISLSSEALGSVGSDLLACLDDERLKLFTVIPEELRIDASNCQIGFLPELLLSIVKKRHNIDSSKETGRVVRKISLRQYLGFDVKLEMNLELNYTLKPLSMRAGMPSNLANGKLKLYVNLSSVHKNRLQDGRKSYLARDIRNDQVKYPLPLHKDRRQTLIWYLPPIPAIKPFQPIQNMRHGFADTNMFTDRLGHTNHSPFERIADSPIGLYRSNSNPIVDFKKVISKFRFYDAEPVAHHADRYLKRRYKSQDPLMQLETQIRALDRLLKDSETQKQSKPKPNALPFPLFDVLSPLNSGFPTFNDWAAIDRLDNSSFSDLPAGPGLKERRPLGNAILSLFSDMDPIVPRSDKRKLKIVSIQRIEQSPRIPSSSGHATGGRSQTKITQQQIIVPERPDHSSRTIISLVIKTSGPRKKNNTKGPEDKKENIVHRQETQETVKQPKVSNDVSNSNDTKKSNDIDISTAEKPEVPDGKTQPEKAKQIEGNVTSPGGFKQTHDIDASDDDLLIHLKDSEQNQQVLGNDDALESGSTDHGTVNNETKGNLSFINTQKAQNSQETIEEQITDRNDMENEIHDESSLPKRRLLQISGEEEDFGERYFVYGLWDGNDRGDERRQKRSIPHDDWCTIPRFQKHGTLSCTLWTYKKECSLQCHTGWNSKPGVVFRCNRKENKWEPTLEACKPGKEMAEMYGLNDLDEKGKKPAAKDSAQDKQKAKKKLGSPAKDKHGLKPVSKPNDVHGHQQAESEDPLYDEQQYDDDYYMDDESPPKEPGPKEYQPDDGYLFDY